MSTRPRRESGSCANYSVEGQANPNLFMYNSLCNIFCFFCFEQVLQLSLQSF